MAEIRIELDGNVFSLDDDESSETYRKWIGRDGLVAPLRVEAELWRCLREASGPSPTRTDSAVAENQNTHPFANPIIRNAMRLVDLSESAGCIGVSGSGPYERDDFAAYLRKFGLRVGTPIECTGVLIVGRNEYDKDEIDKLIDRSVGGLLYVYSQEMFLCQLLCYVNPFTLGEEVIEEFRGGHPALQWISQGWSGWPSTHVTAGNRLLKHMDIPGEGMLGHYGYCVGRNSPKDWVRREVLRRVFEEDSLPNINDAGYMESWGGPKSAARLQKMAESIAAFCRNQLRRTIRSELAISHWESDLAWLKETFYHGHMRFVWPDPRVF